MVLVFLSPRCLERVGLTKNFLFLLFVVLKFKTQLGLPFEGEIELADLNSFSVCESRVEQEGRVDKRSIKHLPSTLQGGEDYTVNKLCLADKLFNEDR